MVRRTASSARELPGQTRIETPVPTPRASALTLLVAAGCSTTPPVVTVALAPAGVADALPGTPPRAAARPARTLWARRMHGSGAQEIGGVAIDATGNVAIVGTFEGTADLGAGPLVDAAPDHESMFVALLDEEGRTRWSRAFAALGEHDRPFVAFDPEGDLVIAGAFSTPALDLGIGPLQRAGASDVFVAKLDPSGRTLWARRFGGPDFQTAAGLAVDLAGNVVVAGTFVDTAPDFGLGPLAGGGSADVFVVGLDPEGNPRWSRAFGGTGADEASAVGVDGEGNVVVAGTFGRSIDFGLGPLRSAGPADVFVAGLSPDGIPSWSRRFGGADRDEVWALGVGPSGLVAVTGPAQGPMDFGAGLVDPGGGGYLVVLDPAGRTRWTRSPAGSSPQPPVFDAASNLFVVGVPTGTSRLSTTAYARTGVELWRGGLARGVGERLAAAVDRRTSALVVAGIALEDPIDLGTGPLSGDTAQIFVVELSR
jgi:hypothetical protein